MVQGQRIPVEIDMEWARYLLVLDQRAGGVGGVSTTELSAEAFDDAGIEDLKATAYANHDALSQAPLPALFADDVLDQSEQISQLMAQVQELQKAINDIQQGYQL